MRRQAFGLAAALAAVCVITPQQIAGQTSRPNFVVIMLDDFDAASVDLMVVKGMLPNIKRYLYDEGFRFANSFSTSTFGAPTRATFLTGQYPHNHGEIGGEPVLGEAPKFNQGSTVATWLKRAGYLTALVGRYTTGYGYATAPTFIPPGWDFWAGLVDPSTWSTSNYVMNIGGSVIDFAPYNAETVTYYQTDILAYLSRLFVQQAAITPQPFFLLATPVVYNREIWPSPDVTNMCPDPTNPFTGGNYWGVTQRPAPRYLNTIFGDLQNFPLPQPPSFNEADVSDKPDWLQSNASMTADDIACRQKAYWRRLESLRAVDDLVGQIMMAVEAAGALNKTYVIFTADNGFMDGQHRFPEKMPAYEESIRVPLLMRVPGNMSPRTVNQLVLNTDLAPTIAQLAAAVATHTVDGRSLVPLLQNPNHTPWRKIGLIEHMFVAAEPGVAFTPPPSYLAARADWPTPRTFVRYPAVNTGVNGELYDIATDPYQLQNLYGDPARQAEVGRLSVWLAWLRTCRGISCVVFENSFTLN